MRQALLGGSGPLTRRRKRRKDNEAEVLERAKKVLLIDIAQRQRSGYTVIGRLPNRKPRNVTWEGITVELLPAEFKRRYRLNLEMFDKLHSKILLHFPGYQGRGPKALDSRLKLGSGIRFLAGGAAVDVMDIHGQRAGTFPKHLWETCRMIDEVETLSFNPWGPRDAMLQLEAKHAALRSGAKGQWRGQVASLDGLIIRTKKPTARDCTNAGTFMCARKSCWGLNAQILCDSDREILWASIKSGAGTHDATAFRSTKLGAKILEEGLPPPFFINVDNAYPENNSLVKPFAGSHGVPSKKDTFNFYQSTQRMPAECSLGILVRRWGVLWRKLECNLEHAALIVRACIKLHNICVRSFVAEKDCLAHSSDMGTQPTWEKIKEDYIGIYANPLRGEDDPQPANIRDQLADDLWAAGCRRPR